jgi:hypothetical protein
MPRFEKVDIAATGEAANNAYCPPHRPAPTVSAVVRHSNQPGKKLTEIGTQILGKRAVAFAKANI